jgi:hypothetical protein
MKGVIRQLRNDLLNPYACIYFRVGDQEARKT